MRAAEGNLMGSVPVLVVAPRMIALYAHTVLDCYATTDYAKYRDFSFAVSRYVLLRLDDESDKINQTAIGDTSVLEAGARIPEIETLDALFKEVQRLKDDLSICECCGERIIWTEPLYMELMSRTIISTPGANRRMLSSFCIDCLTEINRG